MKLTFYGAAGEVTGSQHLVETDTGYRLLLDCGLFQGKRSESREKNERFHCNPAKLDGVILSHAHTDHCGNLPGLYKAGYRGPIFCTASTADLAALMMRDSAKIQREDAEYHRKKLIESGQRHVTVEPLYTEEHAREVAKLFEPLPYGKRHDVGGGVAIRFLEAGHILGSAITELDLPDQGETRRLVFTGDLGRRGLPLLRDPQTVERCDVLITESTYGNRTHPDAENQKHELARIIRRTAEREGRVIIPAFSLGRTQNLLYYLNQLSNADEIPRIPVYVDSPLAESITRLHEEHADSLDREFQQIRRTDPNPLDFPELRFVQSPQESQTLNYKKGAFVVIAGSGMCESGRIVHHLKHGLDDDRNTVVLIGYQAEYTLGRRLQQRLPEVKIHDRLIRVSAEVESLNGLSAHADALDFQWFFMALGSRGGTGQAFIVHGEADAREGVANLLRDISDSDPILPEFGQSYEV